ncbi:hypothetical protein I5J50_gp64 [Mycobacterium phage Purky]|uniref:Uncharacterized protein n=1 Tax=Mycobacterium phage Purky TaxID=2593351 RepID=A0A514TWV1_9CAUD|nr:hypothetical protein I5J50_gp64 [Mycobacterium phage Purky]QDK01167.1 hypothetical protein SEA_PURKY_64 [Mycobacterium phage Purky]
MSDPVAEAVKRTSHAYCHGQIPAEPYSNTNFPGVDEIAEFAAREMAKPIREWCARWNPYPQHRCEYGDNPAKCAWPGHRNPKPMTQQAWRELESLIYSSEELSGE